MTRGETLLRRDLKREMGSTEPLLEEEIERLEENNMRLKKNNKELKEVREKLEKKIKKAISYSKYDEFEESCGRITEKLNNTSEYEDWLIVQEYIDCIIKELK